MGHRYTQLTRSDRLTIEAMLRAERKVKDIADKIGVHQSTIYKIGRASCRERV